LPTPASPSPSPGAHPLPTPLRAPEPLGLRRSFGFGDRIGLGTQGHVAAARRFSIHPVFVQLAPRDLRRESGAPEAWITLVGRQVAASGYTRAWGADAHGVKTEADIARMAAAGATWFTLDPSAFVEDRADGLAPGQIAEELAILGKEGILPAGTVDAHARRGLELDPGAGIGPAPDRDALARAAVKFARALHHAHRLARHVATQSRHAPYDLELALVECAAPATTAEHLFVALEARRRALPLTSLALRWDAGLEPAGDFRGDAAVFESRMRTHAVIARQLGPYKVSVHHGGDKPAILPPLARACGEALHVKTAAASYLAAMRVVARTAPDLFREIAAHARTRFAGERQPRLTSTTPDDVDRLFAGRTAAGLESAFLDTQAGRQLLDTAAGSILHAGLTSRGRPFREAIVEVLHVRRDEYLALLDTTFTRQLELLNLG